MTFKPSEIGPYRIVSRLGQGGMGVVYRAEHRDTGLAVAIKTVLLPREGMISGLRREVHALARLGHPGIIRILDEGLHESVPWYAMELVDGVTLRHWAEAFRGRDDAPRDEETRTVGSELAWWTHGLDTSHALAGAVERTKPGVECAIGSVDSEGGLRSRGAPMQLVLTVAKRLCAPLAFLHGEGLVHRDLKPDNVVLRRDHTEAGQSPDWPVLVDFGLVLGQAGRSSAAELETAGQLVGTACYIAPEQIRGELVDARADLYSFGCILYELLTGRPPFVDRTTQGVLLKHLQLDPEPASARNSSVSAELDELLLRLLAKSPRDRIGQADAVAAALERLGASGDQVVEAPRPRPYLYRPEFVGRREILQSFEAPLSRLADGSGSLVFIGGESGIGKTRLALEMSRMARARGMRVLAAEASQAAPSAPVAGAGAGVSGPSRAGTPPLHTLRKPLQFVADWCREMGQAETERILGQRGRLLALYEASLSGLPGQDSYPAPAELTPNASRLRLFSYLSATFAALAGAHAPGTAGDRAASMPLMLFLDDLQWADELTLGWLEFLVGEGLDRLPLLVVATYRSEELNEPLNRLLVSPDSVRFALARLEESAVVSMVGAMLALSPPPALFGGFMNRQSEGNPFFLAEYLRAAVEDGLLWRDVDGTWQIAETGDRTADDEDYGRLALPKSLRELLERRLNDLPQDAAALTAAASVYGRNAPIAALRRTSTLTESAVSEGATELIRRQVMEESEPGTLRFTHDKLRECAYQRLSLERRRELHRATAETLESESSAPPWATLGEHWEQAGDNVRARAAYLAGGHSFKERVAFAESERLLRAYLRLVETPSAESVRARVLLGHRVLPSLGKAEQALAELEFAVAEARSAGARLEEGRAVRALSAWFKDRGQLDKALGRLEEALRIHKEVGDKVGEVESLISRALVISSQGKDADAQPLYEAAIELSREIGEARLHGVALNNLGILHFHQGRLPESRRRLEEQYQIAQENGDRQQMAVALGNIATTFFDEGNLTEALRLHTRAVEIAQEIGDRKTESTQLSRIANIRNHTGARDEAIPLFEQALEAALASQDWGAAALTLARLAEVAESQGSIEKARELYEEALRLARTSSDNRMIAQMAVGKALLEHLCGESALAAELLREGESRHRANQDRANLVICLSAMGHVSLSHGQPARSVLEEAEKIAEPYYSNEGTGPGKALASFRRAVEAFESGQKGRLFRGMLVDDLSDGWRTWLIDTGRLKMDGTEP